MPGTPAPSSSAQPGSRRLPLVLGLLAALVGGAAGLLWLLSRQSQELVVAITSWPGYEYLYLAEQEQLGRPFGLELKVQQYTSLEDQRQAFGRGDMPAIATTVPEAIAICQEVPARCPLLVLVLDESRGADRIVARRELQEPAQLRGRRIGLERSVLGEFMLARSQGDRPTTFSQFELKYDGPTALVQGLQRGDLDAIVSYAPHDTPLLNDPRFRVLFSSRAIPGEVVDVLAVDPAYAGRHPQQVKALVQTWWAARAFSRRRPEQAAATMAQRQQIPPAAFRLSERELNYPGPVDQPRLLAAAGPIASSLQAMAALMQASGAIRAAAPLPRISAAYLEAR